MKLIIEHKGTRVVYRDLLASMGDSDSLIIAIKGIIENIEKLNQEKLKG